MKKKVISAILCAAMVSTMAVGCSSSDSKKDSKSDKKDGYKVAYIARAQEDSFAAWLADEMRAAFKKTGDMSLEVFDGEAKVVVLQGPAGNFHSTKRREAWKKEFFDKRSDVKILAEDIANWNKDEAMQLMEDWVQAYGQIDAVISMNDNMAAGAIEAVKDNAKYKNMQAYGVDGTAEACLLIKEGKMTSTGLQSAIDLAKMNTEAMHDVLTGKKKVTDINDNVPAPLITSDNVDEYIQMYKDNGQIKE